MRVYFQQTWFAPTERGPEDALGNTTSGQRFRKGMNIVPEHLRYQLPSSAVVVDDTLERQLDKLKSPSKTYEERQRTKEIRTYKMQRDLEIEREAETEVRNNLKRFKLSVSDVEQETSRYRKAVGDMKQSLAMDKAKLAEIATHGL